MVFFSFGKKKNSSASSKLSRRPSALATNPSATSTLSATSSGSSSGSPHPPPTLSTNPARLEKQRKSLSHAADVPASSSNLYGNGGTISNSSSNNSSRVHIPPVSGSSAASSSHSLDAPRLPSTNRDLLKKGSTNTLNSTKNNTRRGPHDPPPLANTLAKPRPASYYGPQVQNNWKGAPTDAGHTMVAAHTVSGTGLASKYHSTGSSFMPRGSYYGEGALRSLVPCLWGLYHGLTDILSLPFPALSYLPTPLVRHHFARRSYRALVPIRSLISTKRFG